MRRATVFGHEKRPSDHISIHALHEESDLRDETIQAKIIYISIHALHEESDAPFSTICATESVFQSTLSMRRATITRDTATVLNLISIHALHEESDSNTLR